MRIRFRINIIYMECFLDHRLRIVTSILFFSIYLGTDSSIHGFQGIMQTSFGARQAGMGGAFQGIGGSVMDLELNPSHLARLTSPKWEFGTAVHSARIEYSDSFTDKDPNISYNNKIQENPTAIFPYLGFIAPVTGRFGLGLALYTQGGGGGNFSNITRLSQDEKSLNKISGDSIPFVGDERRVKEDLEFKFMITKLTFGFGYRFEKLSIGAGVDLVYSFMEMKKTYLDMSRTVDLPGSFSYKSDPAYSYGGKFGFSYDFNEKVRVAYSYTTRNVLHLDGSIQVEDENMAVKNTSRVSRSMVWPDRHIFGISYRTGSWIFDFDVKFIPWSQSFQTSKLVLDHPLLKTPFGSRTNTMLMNFRWKDQFCFAWGAEYKWNYGIRFRAGYSYAKTPTVPQGLSPMLGTTNEHHLAGGLGYYIENYAFHIALEYAFPKSMKGSEFSDWSLSHSVFSPKEIQSDQFQFSKSVSVLSVYFGLEKNI